MTVSLAKVGQIEGVTAFPNFKDNETGRAVVFNPTLPALIFDYLPDGGGIQVGVVIGSVMQTQIYSEATGGSNLLTNVAPTLFFANAIITGGGVCGHPLCLNQNGIDVCSSFYAVYNLESNSFNYSCNVLPPNSIAMHLLDIAVDYENSVVYFLHGSSVDSACLIFSVPFDGLSTLINNLKYPDGWKVSWIQPSNAPTIFGVYPGNLIYYNRTFYLNGQDNNKNYYIYVVPLNSINFSKRMPTYPQSVGQIYKIYSGGDAGIGNIFLNYYVRSGKIIDEILVYIPANYNSICRCYSDVYIYSFDLSTNAGTLLYKHQGANVMMKSINIGGLIAFAQKLSAGTIGGTYAVGIYDRKTNIYEQSQQFPNVLDLKVAKPGYSIVFSGSPNKMTIAVYKILVDITPAIINLQYSNGKLTGTVINLNGNTPLSGVTVYLFQLSTQASESSSGSLIATTTTDINGNFSFNINKEGYYAVKVIQS